ncbi:trans-aconitate methyltransferase [Sarcoptes scabiei]|nr:trans-aconitate methyltransferase [Sarcoptes scabiei]
MEFDPSKYLITSNDSWGPGKELIEILIKNHQEIKQHDPIRIVDLGCGPGNCTELLTKYFPQATIFGLDIDPEMIEYARKNSPSENCHFFIQDLDKPFDEYSNELKQSLLEKKIDIIFSNYALQWIRNPQIICDIMNKILSPKTGILVGNILYSDISSVIDNEFDRKLFDEYMDFPDERRFIGDWLFALKDNGKFNNIWFQYCNPRSIFPEHYYKESFVKIPLKWHEKFIRNSAPEEIRIKLSEVLRKLILKKRIIRTIKRIESNCKINDNEVNDIEIEQQLWMMIVKH